MTQLYRPGRGLNAPFGILREGVLNHRSGTPSRRVGAHDPAHRNLRVSPSWTALGAPGARRIDLEMRAGGADPLAPGRVGSSGSPKTPKAASRQVLQGCLRRLRCLQLGTWKTLGEHVQEPGDPPQDSTSETGLPRVAWRTLQNSTTPPHPSTAIQNPYRVVEKHPNHCNDGTCVVEPTGFSTVWAALYEDDDSFYQGGDQARDLENSTRTENETVTP